MNSLNRGVGDGGKVPKPTGRSGLEQLSGDFNRGYTRAIQDTAEVFAYVLDDLNYHGKRLTGKLALELLHCVLNSREQIRDEWGGFIRWNGLEQKFEYFDRRKGK